MDASPTGGVKPMAIAGRMVRERERLIGMTDFERNWRKQWLKDQELGHHEPKRVPALERELMNPIRRFYRAPLDKLCEALTPVLGFQKAYTLRFWTGKALIVGAFIYSTAYYFKYNQNVSCLMVLKFLKINVFVFIGLDKERWLEGD
ncbi:hypothetical protein ACFFRR_005426 [Megaselia abdita]